MNILSIAVSSALYALAVSAATASGPDPSTGPGPLNFEIFDFDGSESISRDEFGVILSSVHGEADAFDFFDLDHDGFIRRDEFETMNIELMQPDEVGDAEPVPI